MIHMLLLRNLVVGVSILVRVRTYFFKIWKQKERRNKMLENHYPNHTVRQRYQNGSRLSTYFV